MQSPHPIRPAASPGRSRSFLLALGLGLLLFAGAGPARADIVLTADVAQSNFSDFSVAPFPITAAPGWDFAGQDYALLTDIFSIAVTLTLDDGDTSVNDPLDPFDDDFDVNELTLAPDGIDTGIRLNGFRDGQSDTLTIAGVPNNIAAILMALQADGRLVGTAIDASPDDNFIGLPNNFETRLVIQGPDATPEPTSLALLLPGVGAVLLARRRRERS
ncbi:MAG: PEP-CTERM sorting domain-containing protein [Armatimonadetes bacterium]|nr:PEP-CTERM sorting domain-containing protein [Armatimonadota bacterium]